MGLQLLQNVQISKQTEENLDMSRTYLGVLEMSLVCIFSHIKVKEFLRRCQSGVGT